MRVRCWITGSYGLQHVAEMLRVRGLRVLELREGYRPRKELGLVVGDVDPADVARLWEVRGLALIQETKEDRMAELARISVKGKQQ